MLQLTNYIINDNYRIASNTFKLAALSLFIGMLGTVLTSENNNNFNNALGQMLNVNIDNIKENIDRNLTLR